VPRYRKLKGVQSTWLFAGESKLSVHILLSLYITDAKNKMTMLLPVQGMLIICLQARRRKIKRKKRALVCKCWGSPHAAGAEGLIIAPLS